MFSLLSGKSALASFVIASMFSRSGVSRVCRAASHKLEIVAKGLGGVVPSADVDRCGSLRGSVCAPGGAELPETNRVEQSGVVLVSMMLPALVSGGWVDPDPGLAGNEDSDRDDDVERSGAGAGASDAVTAGWAEVEEFPEVRAMLVRPSYR
jgi:hypothetical protein